MTSQAWDFDADLDFDRFGMTGFFEAVAPTIILSMSSSFNGFSEIGLALAIPYSSKKCYPLTKFSIEPILSVYKPLLPTFLEGGKQFTLTDPT